MRNHACPDRIQLDIPVAREHVMLRGNEAGPKATLPERAAAPGLFVHSLDVALAQIFHEEGTGVRRVRREKQVHMVGHQAIGVNRAVVPACKKAQVAQVSKVIGIAEKAQAAIGWCKVANEKQGGKKWSYVVIPDDVVSPTSTLAHMLAQAEKDLSSN